MKFQNLKKNDIIFCESQNSRVIRLGSLINESSWKGYDIFSKQEMIITNQDKFKLVNETKKPNIIKMTQLIESKSSKSTLTEKEVFIVEFFIEELGYEQISSIVDDYLEGDIEVGIPKIKELKNYLNLHHLDSEIFIQYLVCATENEGKEINTNTKIQRVKRYEVTGVQNSVVSRFDDVSWTFYALNEEHAKLVEQLIQDSPFKFPPQYVDVDFGDSDFIDFGNFEFVGDTNHPEKVID